MFYAHGCLALAEKILDKNRSIEIKIKKETDAFEPLFLDQITKRWEDDACTPLFVCEGSANEKKTAIREKIYFQNVWDVALKRLYKKNIAIYGVKFRKEDAHIIQKLKKIQLKLIAISVTDLDDSETSQQYVDRIKKLFDSKKFSITEQLIFYNAQISGCWNNP